jgi:hypothetical protein
MLFGKIADYNHTTSGNNTLPNWMTAPTNVAIRRSVSIVIASFGLSPFPSKATAIPRRVRIIAFVK